VHVFEQVVVCIGWLSNSPIALFEEKHGKTVRPCSFMCVSPVTQTFPWIK
jgi:hypothetical protein